MATVHEIARRIAAEDKTPWPTRAERERIAAEDTSPGSFFDGEPEGIDLDQPTKKPTRKVTAGAITGALSALAAYLLSENGIVLEPENASAATALLALIVSYVVREK